MIFRSPSLSLLFWTFLKIGSTAFGGLISLIAVVENIVVEKMRLLSHEDILDGISLTTFLPGPISTNVVVYVGYRIRGKLGALVSLVGVILPSFCLITGLAIIYFQFGQISQVESLFLGFIPAVVAIIVSTAWQMSLRTIKDWRQSAIALVAAVLLIKVGGVYLTLSLMIISGGLGWFLFRPKVNSNGKVSQWRSPVSARSYLAAFWFMVIEKKSSLKSLFLARITNLSKNFFHQFKSQKRLYLIPCCLLISASIWLILKKYTIVHLFLTFATISVMLFGGAYVGIPLIQEIVVSDRQWLTPQQFAYGIALGQITPGPIVISAAFIGYKVQGVLGALAATVGIFTPPFFLTIGGTQILEWCKQSRQIQAAMKGIRAAVIGMIFAAAWIVGQTATLNIISVAIFSLSLFVLLRWRINTIWLILCAGLIGLLFY